MDSWNTTQLPNMPIINTYTRDLSPGLMRFALMLNGVELPSGPLNYLELGFGQGLSFTVHAATTSNEFWGSDSNPSHAVSAQEWSKAAGCNVHICNDTFAEFNARTDLPEFDIIALHGVWSWMSDTNRRHILDIIHKRLKMGGAVFISYNTLPGWASMMPLRDMLNLHAGMMGSEAESREYRIGRAVDFASTLAAAKGAYFTNTPGVERQLESIKSLAPAAVAHEYFNKDWRPFYFADVASAMGLVKLNFVTSTRLLNQIEAISLPPEAREALGTAANPIMRETVRDYMCNQNFRTDIFIKGLRRLRPLEQMQRMGSLRVALTVQLENIPMQLQGPTGPIGLNEELYLPCLAALADKDYAPKTLEELEDHPLLKAVDSFQLTEILTVLVGAGWAHPAQSDADIAACAPTAALLNTAFCQRAQAVNEAPCLASPVVGCGVGTSRVELLFLSSLLNGGKNPKEWGEDAWNILAGLGEKLVKEEDGSELSYEESVTCLVQLAETFAERRVPLFKALQIIPSKL